MTSSSRSGGYSVTWSQFNSSLSSGIQQLQQNSEFVDMTLAADGHIVQVHQLVMGLASPYLRQLIRSADTPRPVIFLNNVSHKILCYILEYIYTGEVIVPAEEIKTFITTAKALHVKGLDDMLYQEELKTNKAKRASPDVMEAATTLENISTSKITSVDQMPPSKVRKSHFNSNPGRQQSLDYEYEENRFCKTESRIAGQIHDIPIEKETKNLQYTDDSNVDMYEELIEDDIITEDENYEVKSTLNQDVDEDKNKPDVMYTVSNMGGIQLILNRFMYRMRNKYKDGRRRWECVNYNLTKCTASAITKDNNVLARASFHNHPFHDKKIMNKVKSGLVYSSLKKLPPSVVV